MGCGDFVDRAELLVVTLSVKSLQVCPSLADPMDCARQAPLSVEFSRQEYWSGLQWPSPGDLPNPEIEPASLKSPALAGGFFTTSTNLHDPVTLV